MKKLRFILLSVSFFMIFFSSKVSAHSIFVETFSEYRGAGIYMYYKDFSGKLLDCLCTYTFENISKDLGSKLSKINGITVSEKDKKYTIIKGLAGKISETTLAIDYYIESWQNQFLDETLCSENIDKLNGKLDSMVNKMLCLLSN